MNSELQVSNFDKSNLNSGIEESTNLETLNFSSPYFDFPDNSK